LESGRVGDILEREKRLVDRFALSTGIVWFWSGDMAMGGEASGMGLGW
jgi:hypothetical protein